MGNRSKNFSDHEFKCKCRLRAPHLPVCDQIRPPDELINILQDVREYFGAPITIHSGHRCPPYNSHVGGARASTHMDAIAADFTIEGVLPNTVQQYLLERYAGETGGIGRYNTFTHVDVRSYMARWDNRR